jgi:tetratricopeptide (TPR) repeat protein
VSEVEREAQPIAEPEPPAPGQQRWLLGAVVAALLGLLLYLAIQYTGPSAVSDETLEADAIEAVEAGRATEAAENYGELASRAMDNRERASWMLEQASALVQAEQPDIAVQVLREASGIDIGDEDLSLRIVLRLAALLVAAEDHTGALDVYTAIASDDATSPEYMALALLGQLDAAEALGRGSEGWDTVTLALSRHPDNPEIALALARRMSEVLMARERGREALTMLELLPGASWDPLEQANWLLARARVHDDLQELDASLALYEQALEQAGDQGVEAALIRFEVASLRARRGDLDAARSQLEALEGELGSGDLQGHVKLQLAEVLRQLGEHERAGELYREIIDDFPDMEDAVATAREGLGALLFASGDGQQAIEQLFTALEAGEDGAEASLDVLLGYANGLLSRGESEAALTAFERIRGAAADASPWAIAADHGRAGALIQLDRNTDALELLRELRSSCDPEQRLLIDAQIGETLLQSGQLDDAQAAFESLLEVSEELGYGTAAAQLGLAGVAEGQQRYEEAIHLYAQVAESKQSAEMQVSALQALAALYLQLDRAEESLVAYRQVVDLLPTDSPTLGTIRMSMAEVYALREDVAAERALWQELMGDATGSSLARARIRLVELDMADAAGAGDTAAMEAALGSMRALRGDPDIPEDMVPDVVFGEVVCLFELERYERAVEVIQLALEQDLAGPDPEVFTTLQSQAEAALRGEPIDPDMADMPLPGDGPSDEEMNALLQRVSEAGALRDQGQPEQALVAFRELLLAIDDRPTLASIQREIAWTQAAGGDIAGARATLEAQLQDFPELGEASFMARLALAELDLREQDAATALARLVELEAPDDGHALWRLELVARAHSTAGDTEAALRTWREAIELAEGDPEGSVVAWTGLGDLYLQMGEPDHASDAFQRAAVLAPEGSARVQSQLRAAQVAVETGRLDEAGDILAELELGTLGPELAIQVALTTSALAQERGDWQAGLDATAGLSLDSVGPDYQAQVVDARGICALALGQLDQARAGYTELAQRWPEHAEVDAVVSFGLAELEASDGEIEQAAQRLEAFSARSADRFRKGQALLRLGQLFENHGESERAAATYQRVRDEFADEPELVESATVASE